MVCHHPMQASFVVDEFGKKRIRFSESAAKLFRLNKKPVSGNNFMSLPCGKCMGCKLERSRQWAVRIMHEASLYEDNCFVTLTFNDENLIKQCKNGSLDCKHMQNFMKRLRQKFSGKLIRTYYCGEYGEKLLRPHYHVCLFNHDFEDKVYWKSVNKFPYYVSSVLSSLWTFGHSVIGDLTFDSAAYVARYCTKKITGTAADEHYNGRLPEFGQASLKPGIGHGYLERFGESDVFAYDDVVVRGVKCKPPRYYDKYLEQKDPFRYAKMKEIREVRASKSADDNTYQRLLTKEKCLQARFNKLVRTMESI